jgi:hypothetical protein
MFLPAPAWPFRQRRSFGHKSDYGDEKNRGEGGKMSYEIKQTLKDIAAKLMKVRGCL